MTTEAGIAAGGGGGSAGTDGAGAPGADSATQDASIPAVPPPECIPTCLWEVLSSCIDPGATAVEPDLGGCVRDQDHWAEEYIGLVCDAEDGFYFSSPAGGGGSVGGIFWAASCYAGGQLVYTKRVRYGTSAAFPLVFYEDAAGVLLVEVGDLLSYPFRPTVNCGGRDGAGGEVMLLFDALDNGHVIPDHPCAPWISLVSAPSNEYYWPGCTPGDCPDPPSVPMDASVEGGSVETDAAPDGAGLAADAAGTP